MAAWDHFYAGDGMTICTHNPQDTHEIASSTHERNRDAFIRGVLGEATYRACLINAGLRGQDITAEINLALMDRQAQRRQNRKRA